MASQVVMILAAVGLVSVYPATAPAVRSADSFPAAHFSAASPRTLYPVGACKLGAFADGAVASTGCGNLASGHVAISAGLDAAGATIAAITSNSSRSPA
jgi:hypothetical protein